MYEKFIRLKGREAANTGYFVPRLYRMYRHVGMKIFGLSYLKYRLQGWTIWWVQNEDDYSNAIKELHELQKTRIFTMQVSE